MGNLPGEAVSSNVQQKEAGVLCKQLCSMTSPHMFSLLICSRKLLMSLLETEDLVSPIGSMSQGGICVLVGDHYDTMVLYYIIH